MVISHATQQTTPFTTLLFGPFTTRLSYITQAYVSFEGLFMSLNSSTLCVLWTGNVLTS